MKWNTDLNKIATQIRKNEYGNNISDSDLRHIYDYYQLQMLEFEEELTIAQGEKAWKSLEVFENYVFNRLPDLAKKVKEERAIREAKMQADIDSGKIQVVHFNF